MKALVYTALGRLEMQEIPEPEHAAGNAVLKVIAAGVCGSDVDGFFGRSRGRKPPLVMGHEFVGEMTGDLPARGLKAGQAVAVMPLLGCGRCELCLAGKTNLCPDRKLIGMNLPGAFAEYVSAPEWTLYALGAGVSRKAAVMAEPLANGIHVSKIAAERAAGPALVIGAGTIGMCVILALRDAGCEQISVADTNTERLAIAKQIGAAQTLDASDAQAVRDRVKGVGLIVDCVGCAATRASAIELAGIGGLIISIGLHDGENGGEARDVVTRELCIRGSYGYTAGDFEAALGLIERNNEVIERLVEYADLASGQEVFQRLGSQPGASVKVALTP